ELEIDAVHQPQRLEFLLGQFAREAARDLIAEFRNPLGDQRAIEYVVDVHRRTAIQLCRTKLCSAGVTGSAIVGPRQRMSSRRLPGCKRPASMRCTGAM